MKKVLEKIKKISILKLLIYIGVALIVVGGSSFAYLNFFIEGNETNLVQAGCLDVSISEQNIISLSNQVPMTDYEGKLLTPYTYTITNTCDLEAYYEVTLNILNTSQFGNESKVKLYLTGDNYFEPNFVTNFKTISLTNKPSDVRTSYLIDSGYLKQGEIKKFDLRMWIDYDVTSFDGSFDSRIIVTSIADKGPEFELLTTGYQIIGKNGISPSTLLNPNFEFTSPGTNNQLTGLYKTQGINGAYTYYFRGNPNNYFKFGTYAENTNIAYRKSNGSIITTTHNQGEDMLWRILRINEDGSLRLILDDTIGMSKFNNDTTIKYFGDSEVKTYLENFYNKHLVTVDEYIVNTNFCLNTDYKMIENNNYYSSYIRNIINKNPSLSCSENDIYVSKIGLISGDELSFAGNVYNIKSADNYLYKDLFGWWSLSPASLPNNELNYIASIEAESKSIYIEKATTELAVRPVISIGNNYFLKGDGTISNPYTLAGEITK